MARRSSPDRSGRAVAYGKVRSSRHSSAVWRPWPPQSYNRYGKIVRRTFQRKLAQMWDKWVEVREGRLWLQRIARHALNLPLARAYETWIDKIEAQKAAQKAKHAKMAKFGKRMLLRGLNAAWNKWCSAAAERARLRGFLRRALQRGVVKVRTGGAPRVTPALTTTACSPTLKRSNHAPC